MEKYILIMLSMFFVNTSFSVEISTPQMTATLVTAVEANDTALDANTTSWAYAKSWTEIPQDWSTLKVMFYATEPNDPNGETLDPNDCTFDYKFYIADYGNSGQLVADGNAVVGFMRLSHNPLSLVELNGGAGDPNTCWIDTLGTITEDWNGTIAGQNDGGSNDAASIIIGRESGKTATCIITGMSSTKLHVYCIAYGY